MDKNLHEYRKSYEKGTLDLNDINVDPMKQFNAWFSNAENENVVEEINAMTLTTASKNGMPRARVVLLKEVTEEGFIFYTNYSSEKGQAIAENNQVCISFFWPALEQQIIIKGKAQKISEGKSIAYFNSRPRASQLGALVSDQSSPIVNRVALEKKLTLLENEYEDKGIPKPLNWGGYLIIPLEFEFWQGRASRLHDRIQYSIENGQWITRRLQP
ncbi:pyridoxine/pyridoxamine 5'-phosphate oxidase [Patiriisocius marinistellae]|uniref:Pyridoxine/pyridoxamine 5'-phosphate oxidase n=1 Tax=Patiriisocius marinistellae TaxID=2494560 RepID=A0A5J4FYK4_9FLAO|nr:pyridoxamine 5'-phosphate oxidase [Patiriisocius marinistellae]GEQ86264.1 pyridoxine/pyridoxamine 5'-phosphate oxidase [Patiriisocius marinistellae]